MLSQSSNLAANLNVGQVFPLYIALVHSVVCMSTWQETDVFIVYE